MKYLLPLSTALLCILLIWNLSVMMLSCSYIHLQALSSDIYAYTHSLHHFKKSTLYCTVYYTWSTFVLFLLPSATAPPRLRIDNIRTTSRCAIFTNSYCNCCSLFAIMHKYCISWPVYPVIMVGHLMVSFLNQSDLSCRNVYDHMLESHWPLSWWCDRMWTSGYVFTVRKSG